VQRHHPQVCFAGMLHGSELSRAYASADVFVFPSRSETFGNVVLEAAASGLVVAAYDRAAARQHLRDRVSACLARDDSVLAFDAALLRAVTVARTPWHPMRTLARQAALGADWTAVLDRFEARLRALARCASVPAVAHARLA
jgi:glycosyltransferase involved in cell wall biosynthesis